MINMKIITKFSTLTPIERVSLIESISFWDLVELKNTLEFAYQSNGMWEAYIIQCDIEIQKRREDKINSILE